MKYRKEMQQAVEKQKIAQALNDSPIKVLDVISERDSIHLKDIRVLEIPYKVETFDTPPYAYTLTAKVGGVTVFSIYKADELSAEDIERCEK